MGERVLQGACGWQRVNVAPLAGGDIATIFPLAIYLARVHAKSALGRLSRPSTAIIGGITTTALSEQTKRIAPL